MSGPGWSRRRWVLVLWTLGSLFAPTLPATHAQPVVAPVQINNQYKIKAKLLYFLPDFMTWSLPRQQAGDVWIGYIHHGDTRTDFTQEIAKDTMKVTSSGRKVHWVPFKTADDLIKAPLPQGALWHLIFVMQKDENAVLSNLEKLQSHFNADKKDKGVVLITEENNRFRKLAGINFYEDVAANRIRIQLRNAYLKEQVGVTPKPEMLKIEGILVY